MVISFDLFLAWNWGLQNAPPLVVCINVDQIKTAIWKTPVQKKKDGIWGALISFDFYSFSIFFNSLSGLIFPGTYDAPAALWASKQRKSSL